MLKINKKIIITTIAVILGVAYLYLTNFSIITRFFGTEVPLVEKPPINTGTIGSHAVSFLKTDERLGVDIFASGLEGPRVISFDPNGKMVVSEPSKGDVVMLEDRDNDGFAESKEVLISNLKSPHGLAFYKNLKTNISYIYIAEENQVNRYKYDVSKSQIIPNTSENIASVPAGGRHTTRTIGFGPNYRKVPIVNGIQLPVSNLKLYISVGSSCDVCVESDWKRASILESDPDGNYTAEFAGGLRNSVFFTFQPQTGEMWATDMGRDYLGDYLPPDEINIVKVADTSDKFGARRYGWPFCYGNKVKDTTFKPDKVDRIDVPQDCSKTESPTIEVPPHSAPLGLAFINNPKWPKDWQGDLLVAFHGSWNSSIPVGYKVVRYDLDESGKVLSQTPIDFITGWIDGKLSMSSGKAKILGRPVDLKFSPDGTLYISDDVAGVIYRLSLQ